MSGLKENLKLIKIFFFSFLIFLLFSNFSFSQQKSASLFLSPASGTYQVGQTFNVILAVKSEQEAINAVEATIKFDPTIIRVRSISKTGSIFTLWPEEPTFSNSAGTIHFVGGVPAPNFYKGSSGRIITITFEGLKEGTASVTFTKGIILTGPGIDVTDKLIGATFTIVAGEVPPPTPPSTLTPSAPKISSPTHPDPEKWYNNNDPKVVWEVPSGILAVRTLLGKIPTAQPTVVYEPPISSKEFEDLEDGIWYFSAQFKNEQGWGEIGRFKIQIDTTPPKEFSISVDNEGDLTNPTPKFYFQTTDEPSGIDYYEVILNGESFAKVKPEEVKEGYWRPSPLSPKDYSLLVKAFDKAGNFTQSKETISFSVSPIPLEIEKIPQRIKAGEYLEIKGKTLPEIKVKLFFQREGEGIQTKEIDSDKEGKFVFKELLPKGKYLIWLESEDKRGAKSYPTEKQTVEVVVERLTLYISIILAILILIGLIIIFLLLRKIKKEKEKAKKERIQKIKEEKLKAYSILKEKIEEQIKYLEGKVDLSRSEIKILEALKSALKEAEETRSKEQEIEEKR